MVRKKRIVSIPIRVKYSILVITLITLVAAFITLPILQRQTRELETKSEQLARTIVKNLADNFGRSRLAQDDTALIEAIKDCRALRIDESGSGEEDNLQIKYAIVCDTDWTVLFHSDAYWTREMETRGEGRKVRFADAVSSACIRHTYSPQEPFLVQTTTTNARPLVYYPRSHGWFRNPKFGGAAMREEGVPVQDVSVHVIYENHLWGYARIGVSRIPILRALRKATWVAVLFGGLGAIAGAVGAWILTVIVTAPIKRLEEGAREIGRGKLDHRIVVTSRDELGRLADAFNNMTEDLSLAQKLRIEHERMGKELEVASSIQQSMMPHVLPRVKDLQFAAFSIAAKGVGGDYFDYVALSDTQIGMIMADVSGKGVPAALIMVAIRTVLKSFDEKEVLDPQHVLSVMNSALSVEETEKYATMYYCVFDSGTGRMVYANGGHGPLLLFRASLGQFEDLDTPGMPVGVLPDTTFGSGETRLQRGDIGVIYTDGITEAMTAAREEYSLQRVREVVRANANRSAQEIADTILAEIKEFVGDAPQHDDETLIVIKYI